VDEAVTDTWAVEPFDSAFWHLETMPNTQRLAYEAPNIMPRIQPLQRRHKTKEFACGYPELNEYLRRFALTNLRDGYDRTYVALGQTPESESMVDVAAALSRLRAEAVEGPIFEKRIADGRTIECYIVKNGVCVAKHRQPVNIGSPSTANK